MTAPRQVAEWEAVMHLGIVFTRDAFDVQKFNRREKRGYHQIVSILIQIGRLPQAATQLCVYCHGAADRWHHPSYDIGFHDVVQPVCKHCHDSLYNDAKNHFYSNHDEEWAVWHRDDMTAVIEYAVSEIENRQSEEVAA